MMRHIVHYILGTKNLTLIISIQKAPKPDMFYTWSTSQVILYCSFLSLEAAAFGSVSQNLWIHYSIKTTNTKTAL